MRKHTSSHVLALTLAIVTVATMTHSQSGRLYDPARPDERIFNHLLGVHPYSISNALECSHDGDFLFSGEGALIAYLRVDDPPITALDFTELKRVQVGKFGVRP